MQINLEAVKTIASKATVMGQRGKGGFRASRNDAATTLRQAEALVNQGKRRVDLAEAGVTLASMFLAFPWLSGVIFSVDITQYKGETLDSVTVAGVQKKPGAALPMKLIGPSAAEAEVNAWLQDQIPGRAYELLGCGDEDIILMVSTIADLLTKDEIDGFEVISRFFPKLGEAK